MSINPRRALVTGGAGFIGSNVVRKLLEMGTEVVVLDDYSCGADENLPKDPRLELATGDVRDYEQVLQAAEGADVVFHLAAQVGNVLSLERPDTDLATNALGTINMLKACCELSIPKMVYSSSGAIFGETAYVPVDEDHPKVPVSAYGISKLSAEHYCLVLGAEYGLRVSCLRYFNAYGLNQRFNPYGNVIPIFVERALKGDPLHIFGDGEQTRDFVDVRDLADANLLACDRDAHGVFNIGTGVATTINQLAQHVVEAVGNEVAITYGPSRAGEVRDSVADISKAVSELGFTPSISIGQGVKDYVAWYAALNAA